MTVSKEQDIVATRDCYIWEECGYFWLADEYSLNNIRFDTLVQRQRWIDGYKSATGRDLIVHKNKPDVMEALIKGLPVSEESKARLAKKYDISRGS